MKLLKERRKVPVGTIRTALDGRRYQKQPNKTWTVYKEPMKVKAKKVVAKVWSSVKGVLSKLESEDLDDLRNLLLERTETPAQVKHCVRRVADQNGGDVSKAFAICVASGQKRGTLKPGTIKSTAKGKKADAKKKKEPGHDTAVKDYEQHLDNAKKDRSTDMRSNKSIQEAKSKLKWEDKGNSVFVAFTKIAYETIDGKSKSRETALRIDGRHGTFRVDMKNMSPMPWEAIDGGKGFTDFVQAKDHADKWVAAANAQKTFDPKMEQRVDRTILRMRYLAGLDPHRL